MKHVRSILTLGMLLAPAAAALPEARAAGGEDGRPAQTRTSDEAWSGAVNRFARALAEGEDESAALATLSDQHAVRTLGGHPGRLEDLAALARSARWTRAFWYGCVPDQLATDIAAAVTADPTVDPEFRRFLTPGSEPARRNADVTAVKWVAAALAPRADQPVGVIVMHHPPIESADAQSTPRAGRMTVVLVSGERVGLKLFRVRNVAFGRFDVKNHK